ncbi:MAG: flagellar protein FlaG [Zoogloeaceae bacterium]|jgi:flagellar protein FlaG|nr:flagellar protein FlaG [Zoogloeaceae bacterium]
MDINSISSVVGGQQAAQTGVTRPARVASPQPAGTGGASTPERAQVAGTPGRVAEGTPVVTGRENANDPQNESAFQQNLQKSVQELNEFIKPYATSLQFSIDDDLGRVVIKITDQDTQEVIKQIPSEEALELAKALGKLKGLLIQQKA